MSAIENITKMSTSDLIGISLAVVSVILALMAVYAAIALFTITFRSEKHLKEVEDSRKDLLRVTDELQKQLSNTASITTEVRLGFSIVTALIILQMRSEQLNALKLRKANERKALESEKLDIGNKIKAREIELKLISNGQKPSVASLNGLTGKFGDHETINFLERLSDVYKSRGQDATLLHNAKVGIQWRIESTS